MKENLGKLRKIGETFITTTKKMYKGGYWYDSPKYKFFRPGDKATFIKGKRLYFCEVLFLVEIKTGHNVTPFDRPGPRYWQFSYLVKIIEN